MFGWIGHIRDVRTKDTERRGNGDEEEIKQGN